MNKLKVAACFLEQLPKIVIKACNKTNMNSSIYRFITDSRIEMKRVVFNNILGMDINPVIVLNKCLISPMAGEKSPG